MEINGKEEIQEVNRFQESLPTQITIWTKIKNFLCKDIVLELTPRQEARIKSINDFWHQEITAEAVHNFLYQEIKF